MNSTYLPYIALLLLLIVGAGSCVHRKHLDDTLRNIQSQIDSLDKRDSVDPANVSQLKAELASCQESLKRHE